MAGRKRRRSEVENEVNATTSKYFEDDLPPKSSIQRVSSDLFGFGSTHVAWTPIFSSIEEELHIPKEVFDNCEVVGIVDRKILIFLGSDQKMTYLLAADQHGVHERLRFEALQASNSDLPIENLAKTACRGALRFGDKISKSTAHRLLSSLRSASYPFQCAHGRLTISILATKPVESI